MVLAHPVARHGAKPRFIQAGKNAGIKRFMKYFDVDMRDAFFDELYAIAKEDQRVIFITADMGAFSLVRFKKDFPKQYLNVGVAEQNMVSIAAGLALAGKIVFVYSIVPFVTMRCYEQIKIDLCCMNLPVTIIGIGAGFMYGGDGPTHHGIHDVAVMRGLPNLCILNPSDAVMTQASARISYENTSPTYVRIEKGKLPLLYKEGGDDFSSGISEIKEGSDVKIIATGFMVHQAVKIAEMLKERTISAGVVDIYKIKPINKELLMKIIDESKCVVSLEENSITGGIGSAISEILSDCGKTTPLKRIALPDQHCFKVANREFLHFLYRMDAQHIADSIEHWYKEGKIFA